MPFGGEIDVLLDTLGSATSEEVETALQEFSMRDIVGVLVQRFLDTEAGGNSGSSSSLNQTFSLSAQQIKDSMLTPHTIIAAQGADTFVVPTMYVFRLTVNSTPYADGTDLDLVYGDADLNNLTDILGAAEDNVQWTSGAISAGFSEGGPATDYLNKPVKFAANLRGAVVTAAPFEPGTGYAPGDTGTIDDGSPLATYIVDSVGAGGGVTALTITGGGGDYSLAAGRTHTEWTTTPGGSQPGAGSGLVASVTAVDASASAGDGTLSGLVYYEVADLT